MSIDAPYSNNIDNTNSAGSQDQDHQDLNEHQHGGDVNNGDIGVTLTLSALKHELAIATDRRDAAMDDANDARAMSERYNGVVIYLQGLITKVEQEGEPL